MKAIWIAAAALFLATGTAYSAGTGTPPGNPYGKMLNENVAAKKQSLIAGAMKFSEPEALVFWEVYDEYQREMEKLYQSRVELLQEYQAMYNMLSDEMAWSMAEQAFDMDERELNLRRKYYKKFNEKIAARRVAQFFHVENQINNMMQLQVMGRFSLMF